MQGTNKEAQHKFYIALEENDLLSIRKAINEGADINLVNPNSRKRYPPLHIAIFQQNLALVSGLLELGADPNIIDGMGISPTQIALFNCKDETRVKMIQLLIDNGSNPYIVNSKGASAISASDVIWHPDIEIIKQVLHSKD